MFHFGEMKNWLIFVICSSICCAAEEEFACQSFDENTKLFEYYCKEFHGIASKNCSTDRYLVDSFDVAQLKIKSCNQDSVLYAIQACQNVRVLDISSSGYESLDSFNLKHSRIKLFNVSHNELSSIPTNLLANVPDLIEVDFSYNKIEMLRLLTGVEKLKRIDLSYNQIDSIDDDAFSHLINLEFMDLSNNHINRIKANVYSNLRFLHTLHLENNPIDTFNCENLLKSKMVAVHMTWHKIEFFNTDCEAAKLHIVLDSKLEGFFPAANGNYEIHCHQQSFQNIISFTAGYNQFENIIQLMDCFGSTVVGLYLDGNFIGRFISMLTFQRFINLKELSLRDTELTEFDFAILKQQDQLRTLDISNNSLKQVNNIWFSEHLENFIEFSAANNQFDNVSIIINHLTSAIKTLDLSSNFIGKLNEMIFDRLKGLEVLNLSNTSLIISDFSLFNPLESLEMLDISQNYLAETNFLSLSQQNLSSNLNQSTNQTVIECHEYLRTLNLSNTNLPIKDFQPFEHLRRLENLDISYNHLRTINFTRLSIKILDLSGNYLGEVNTNTFDKLRNLVGLKLSNTSLVISNTNPFESLKRLAVLDLSNNNLNQVDFQILAPTLNKLFGFQATNCHIKNASAIIHHLGSTLMSLDLSNNFVGDLNVDKLKTLRLYSLHLNNANVTSFNYNALNLVYLRSLRLSENRLREIDFWSNTFADNSITELNLDGNELTEIRNLNRHRFKWLRKLAISKNRLPCEHLAHLIRMWNGKFVGNPWDQKHNENCHYLIQNVNLTQTTTTHI